MTTTSPKFPIRDRVLRKVAVLSTVFLLSSASLVLAANTTASELLERGIYSEETKGDIEGAIKLYQQIVTESGINQALAAQAQFRLAMCYDKKKDYAAATTAFEKLVREYPTQKDLVALANEYLSDGAALLPVPWKSGEELSFDVKLPGGAKIGIGRYTVDADEMNGRKIWRMGSHLNLGTMQQWSRAEVDADSFKPIHSVWKHTLIGEAESTYKVGGVDLTMKGKEGVKYVELTGAVYENEQAIQLMRRLPLAAGYKTTMTVFAGLGGGAVLPIKLDVAGPEAVEVPAGKFECYKVILSIGQTFWFSADAQRLLVKFEAGGVVAELAKVRQRVPGERVLVQDSVLGFSFQTPPDGMAARMEKADDTSHSTYTILDPAGAASMHLKVERRERFDEKARQSPRAFAEYKIEQGKKFAKTFTIRPDSWQDITIDGQPGVTFVADFEAGEKSYVLNGAYAFVGDNSLDFAFWGPPESFEGFKPSFNAVIASYRKN